MVDPEEDVGAFDGNALVITRFNKDVLLRGEGEESKKEDEPEQPAA